MPSILAIAGIISQSQVIYVPIDWERMFINDSV